jgi:Glycosyltransferases involved in cell wall biogenesis
MTNDARQPNQLSLVSVVVPTYNRAQLLPRALQSALSQTHATLEIIVVDDGSTDSTREVVGRIADADSRVRYVHQANQGLAGARNTGIATAQGDYVTFLDSDDELCPDHVALRAEYLDENPATMMVHGGLEVVNGSPMVPDYYRPGELVDARECAVGATFFSAVNRGHGRGVCAPHLWRRHRVFERATARVTVTRVPWPTYRYYRDTPDSIVTKEIGNDTGTGTV